MCFSFGFEPTAGTSFFIFISAVFAQAWGQSHRLFFVLSAVAARAMLCLLKFRSMAPKMGKRRPRATALVTRGPYTGIPHASTFIERAGLFFMDFFFDALMSL